MTQSNQEKVLETQYLDIFEYPAPARKTRIFTVHAKDGTLLGNIEWYSHERRYCFSPYRPPFTIWFDDKCMTTIAKFMNMATNDHFQRKGG